MALQRWHVLPLPLRLLLGLYSGHLLLLAPDFLRELGAVVVRVSLLVLKLQFIQSTLKRGIDSWSRPSQRAYCLL